MMRYILLSLFAGALAQDRPVPTLDPSIDWGWNIQPTIDNATAADPQEVCPGYTASNFVNNSAGIKADLSLAGKACNVYGTDVEKLRLTVQYQAKDRLNVKILPLDLSDPKDELWYTTSGDHAGLPPNDKPTSAKDSDLEFSMEQNPFSFTVTRKSDKEVLFSTKGSKIVYENQYLEFKSELPENANLYGLGDRITKKFRLGQQNATVYAADIGDTVDANLYGSHPVYLEHRYKNGKGAAHGVFSRNFYGQDILTREDSITYRTIGGSIDLYFYAGPTPEKVTQSYVQSIGLPAMQQYWTLGFHQCRWGYRNISELRQLVDDFKKFEIPVEAVWLDIDYMDQYRDFTNDPVTYPLKEFQDWLKDLHATNQKMIPIVDAAIYINNPNNESDYYDTYQRGHDLDVFMKNPDGSEYIGAVWPGYTVFPDFIAKNAQKWWSNEVVQWFKEVAFDGIWLDMNEVASFCAGSCGSGKYQENPVHVPFKLPGEPGAVDYRFPEFFNTTNSTEWEAAQSASAVQESANSATATPRPTGIDPNPPVQTGIRNLNHPPYAINNAQGSGDLAIHRLSPNSTHSNGQSDYELASLYGIMSTRATYNALLDTFPGKRPFVLARSTAPGSGGLAAHWGGDNYALWEYAKYSIQQALNFGLFGIPFFGVDTCGFAGNSGKDLCSRWMQLSAFFTFYRNHNVLNNAPQEPYRWADVAEHSKIAMKIRYSILPYFYTLSYHAHKTGSTILRALSWEFPDEEALATVDEQFMVGKALMVLPVLQPNKEEVTGVFPGGATTKWYDWYTGKHVPSGNNTVVAPLGHIPLYVRGGNVIPMQQPGYTTTEGREKPFEVLVALDTKGSATGDLYIDDGESLDVKDWHYVTLTAKDSCLKINTKSTGSLNYDKPVESITIMGVDKKIGSVMQGVGKCKKSAKFTQKDGKMVVKVGMSGWKAAAKGWEVCWK